MSKIEQIDAIYEDLVEIFDEEFGKRNLITPQNTAEKLTDKGYRKASDVAEEIFAEIEKIAMHGTTGFGLCLMSMGEAAFEKLKKKYTESCDGQAD